MTLVFPRRHVQNLAITSRWRHHLSSSTGTPLRTALYLSCRREQQTTATATANANAKTNAKATSAADASPTVTHPTTTPATNTPQPLISETPNGAAQNDREPNKKTRTPSTPILAPIVLQRGYQNRMWDAEGREYLDFSSASATLNHGHCHPHVVAALASQAAKLTVSTPTLHTDLLPAFRHRLAHALGYHHAIITLSNADAVATAVALARRAAATGMVGVYDGCVVVEKGHAWGHAYADAEVLPTSTRHDRHPPHSNQKQQHRRRRGGNSRNRRGRDDGDDTIPDAEEEDVRRTERCTTTTRLLTDVEADDLAKLEAEIAHASTCAVLLEAVRYSSGIHIRPTGYLQKVAAMCKKHSVLFVLDEVYTGLGRCGSMLYAQREGVRPDITVVGTALGGGMLPVSAVLCTKQVLRAVGGVVHTSQGSSRHTPAASTPSAHVHDDDGGGGGGGSPLGCAVGMATLDVLETEGLCENAEKMGLKIRGAFQLGRKNLGRSVLNEVRGTGLLNAVVVNDVLGGGRTGLEVCTEMGRNGVLADLVGKDCIRLSPALGIGREEVNQACIVVRSALRTVGKLARKS